MADTQNIPWNRIAVEAAAIVASILLAFAIEAWWTERQDRIDETELLARLHAEIVENIERLESPQYRIGLQDAVDLFEAVDEQLGRGKDSLDWPTLLLYRTMFMSSFEAHSPILDGLVSSGKLELIDDMGVVAGLAHWEANIRGYYEMVQRSRRHLDSRLIPVLLTKGDVGSVLAGGNRMEDMVAAAPPYTDVTTIRIDAELKGLLGERINVARITVASLGWAKKSGESLLDAVSDAQSRSN